MGLADIPAVSFEDDLTGLYNRRYLQRYLSTQLTWTAGQSPPVSFVLVDIDKFHRANDLYGREEGDHVLRTFADRLKKLSRAEDVVARDSGDSFFLVLPGMGKDAAEPLASQIVRDLRQSPLLTERDRLPVPLTASAGVVSFPEDGTTPEAIRNAADKVLFHAKRSGGDRVSVGGRIDELLAAERDLFAGLPCRTFCGRQPEFQAALGVLDALRAGHPPVLFIQGPAGVGKSRFLREVAGAATARNLLYLYAICNESHRHSLATSLIYLVDQYYRLNPEAQQDLHDRLFPAQRRVARDLIASLSSWREEDPAVSPRDRKPLLLGMLETAVLAMTRHAPLLILLDNARHCDRATLDVLQRVLHDRQAAVAIFFAFKGDVRKIDPKTDPGLHELVDQLERSGAMQVLTLVPLERDDVSRMIASILPNSNAERDFEELLTAKSGGNPLYVEEAIRALLLRGRIRREGERYVVPKIEPDELPSSLDAVIEQVLATLSPEAGELVTNAAIIGSRFDLQVLQEVLGKREAETLDAVDQVQNTRLIEHLERGTIDDYAFRSSTAREVRYVTTAEEARQLMHRRLAGIARAQSVRVPDRAQAERAYHLAAASPAPQGGEEQSAPSPALPAGSPVGRPPRLPEGASPLSADALEHAFDFMRSLTALLRIGRLYPQWSQAAVQFTRQLHESALALVGEAQTATFTGDGRSLLINGRPPEGVHTGDVQSDFTTLLAERLVTSLTLTRGLESRELETLVAALAAPMNRARTSDDHWDRFLDRQNIRHLDILQRRYVAQEGEPITRVMRLSEYLERPLTPEEFDLLHAALRHFKAACDNLRLYPPGHAIVEQSLDEAVRSLTGVVGRVKVLVLAASEEGLLVNGHPTDARTVGDAGAALAAQLAKRELNSLTLVDGLQPHELQALISILAVPPEDPAWKNVLQTVFAGNEIRHLEFGGLQYTQLTSAAGGTMPPAPSPPANIPEPPTPEPEGTEEIAFTGVTVRADVRARAYLKSPPEALLSEDFEREFAPLLEVLNFRWAQQLSAQLVARLAELARDPAPTSRERALKILSRGLLEVGAPEARGLLVTKIGELLGPVVAGELEPSVLLQAAEAAVALIPAAFALGRLDVVADVLTRVRKRIDAKTALPEFRTRITAKLHEFGGSEPAVAEAVRAPSAPTREAILRVCGMFGPALAPCLIDFIAECDQATERRLAALALKEIGGAAGMELAKRVTSDGPAEKMVRVLSVLDAAGPPTLASAVFEAVEHADPAVRAAAFAMLRRADKLLAVGGLRRLMQSDHSPIVMAAVALGGELGLSDLNLDVTRIAHASEDEAVIRACCDYIARVNVPSAVPALWRIFEARPRMFGLVKGFSDDTRAMAVRAAAGIAHPEARELVEEAKRDRSIEVRKAAGA
ncbi:MAG: diguanylate cyclase [Planctomycetes bacterium]|nr:diguanylate cyclase [Planctomycetota bacterium]